MRFHSDDYIDFLKRVSPAFINNNNNNGMTSGSSGGNNGGQTIGFTSDNNPKLFTSTTLGRTARYLTDYLNIARFLPVDPSLVL